MHIVFVGISKGSNPKEPTHHNHEICEEIVANEREETSGDFFYVRKIHKL